MTSSQEEGRLHLGAGSLRSDSAASRRDCIDMAMTYFDGVADVRRVEAVAESNRRVLRWPTGGALR